MEEVSYIRKQESVFDTNISDFFLTELLGKQINEKFENKICVLEKNSQFFEARKNSFELEKNKQLDAVRSMKKKRNKNLIKEIA